MHDRRTGVHVSAATSIHVNWAIRSGRRISTRGTPLISPSIPWDHSSKSVSHLKALRLSHLDHRYAIEALKKVLVAPHWSIHANDVNIEPNDTMILALGVVRDIVRQGICEALMQPMLGT